MFGVTVVDCFIKLCTFTTYLLCNSIFLKYCCHNFIGLFQNFQLLHCIIYFCSPFYTKSLGQVCEGYNDITHFFFSKISSIQPTNKKRILINLTKSSLHKSQVFPLQCKIYFCWFIIYVEIKYAVT